MATKNEMLEELRSKIEAENPCDELRSSATQLVFGDGSADADIVFIGEAPGKQEDIKGTPFVGASGKFLEEMLASIDMSRKDVYITNIVKYRPPKNRDPLPQEKAQFLPYLKKQLDIIQPLLVVTLGRHSMEVLIPGQKISSVHGKPQQIEGRTYLPLFHPAAALYNGSLRQTLKDDFLKIPAILQSLTTKTV